jgi:hypothetical protein
LQQRRFCENTGTGTSPSIATYTARETVAMTSTTIANAVTAPTTEMRALSADEIDAVGGGIIVGVAVGAFVAYMGLHAAVETFLLNQQEREYAAR